MQALLAAATRAMYVGRKAPRDGGCPQLSSPPSNGFWSLGEQQSAAVHLAALAENLMLQHSNGLGTVWMYVAVEKFVPSR